MDEENPGNGSDNLPEFLLPTIVPGTVAVEPAAIPAPCIGVAVLRSLEILISRPSNMPQTRQQEAISAENPQRETKTVLETSPPTPEGNVELSAYAMRRMAQGVRYYELTRKVRDTLFGAVHHALELVSATGGFLKRMDPPRQVAVKVYFHAKLREYANKTHENPWNEIAAGQYLPAHPHVMTLDDCCYDGENVYGIMEFCDGGEMFEIVHDSENGGGPSPMTEAMARVYFKQLVSGLKHCHERGVAHRDLSLENIICKNAEEMCKIIDFGMCIRVPQDEMGRYLRVRPQGIVGKKNYTAPEIISNSLPFNPMHADIWSMGVILFILLTSYPPMEAAAPLDPRFLMICRGQIRTLLDNWGFSSLSSEVQDLLFLILRHNPQDRPTLNDIENHPWMSMTS